MVTGSSLVLAGTLQTILAISLNALRCGDDDADATADDSDPEPSATKFLNVSLREKIFFGRAGANVRIIIFSDFC
jgi:hypothetical protein